MNYTWSYSSISLFQQCPRKYHRLRVVKDIVEPVQEHLLYGSAVHKAAEEYVRDGTPIPEKYAFIQEYLGRADAEPRLQLRHPIWQGPDVRLERASGDRRCSRRLELGQQPGAA